MDRTHPDSWQTLRHFPATNMTLRDYFAGQVLPSKAKNYHPDGAAKLAYEYADAMLAAREVKP